MPYENEFINKVDEKDSALTIANLEKDFDNDASTNAAVQFLKSHGITSFAYTQVGPDRLKGKWDLATQLGRKISFEDTNNKDYIFFTLPVERGLSSAGHAVAVVIDKRRRSVYIADSLNDLRGNEKKRVQQCCDSLYWMEGFSIYPSRVKQQYDSLSCGIYTAHNIFQIIKNAKEINKNQNKLDEKITAVSQVALETLTGSAKLAYIEYGKQSHQAIAEPRLNARQKKALKFAIVALYKIEVDSSLKTDLNEWKTALEKELPPGVNANRKNTTGRPFEIFYNEFKSMHPQNSLNDIINSNALRGKLPKDMADNTKEKSTDIETFLKRQLLSLQTKGKEKTILQKQSNSECAQGYLSPQQRLAEVLLRSTKKNKKQTLVAQVENDSNQGKETTEVSIHTMKFSELSQKVLDKETSNQDILNEASLRLKAGEIRPWQLRNLIISMPDRKVLIFPAKVENDIPEVRKHLFEKLQSCLTSGGSFYWSGTPEASNDDFLSLAQDISKLDLSDMESMVRIQDRAISALGKLLISNDPAGERVRDIASAFLDFPGVNNASVQDMRKSIQSCIDNAPNLPAGSYSK